MYPQYFLTIICALWFSNATTASHAQTYRFDFGSSKAAEGFQAVMSSMTYNSDRGFGFEPGAIPNDVVRGKGSNLTKDFVTSTGVFCFFNQTSGRELQGDTDVWVIRRARHVRQSSPRSAA